MGTGSPFATPDTSKEVPVNTLLNINVGINDEVAIGVRPVSDKGIEGTNIDFQTVTVTAGSGTLDQPILTIAPLTVGSSVDVLVSDFAFGSTNSVFARLVSEPFSDLPNVTVNSAGEGSMVLTPGDYYAFVISSSGNMQTIGSTDPVFFRVRATEDISSFYRVIGFDRVPGAKTMRVRIEKTEKPIEKHGS